MGENIWNNAVEYLKKSRANWWNNDYMEFLIERVWKIKEPVSIVDFGCGIGFLGELLLPLLPKGSTYTGIDIGGKLLEEAQNRFKNTGYETYFIEADLTEYVPKEKYDIAICQTVLQHITEPIRVLEKMKDSVKTNGMVICIELNRDVNSAATYIDGLDFGKLNLLGVEQKIRRGILDRTKKDFEIGLKLPVYMEKIGLKNVDIRVNDYVQFVTPSRQSYQEDRQAFMSGGHEKRMAKENKEKFIKNLTDGGLKEQESEQVFNGHFEISNYIHDHEEAAVVSSNCMFISYGYNFE